MNLGKVHPESYRGLVSLDKEVASAIAQAGLDPLLAELVRIRISQLNGCAFCLRMHTRDALAEGETADRLAVLAAWWGPQSSTAGERAARALAEQVPSPDGSARRPWDDGSLPPEQVSAIGWLAIVMNAWNRVAVPSHYPVVP